MRDSKIWPGLIGIDSSKSLSFALNIYDLATNMSMKLLANIAGMPVTAKYSQSLSVSRNGEKAIIINKF